MQSFSDTFFRSGTDASIEVFNSVVATGGVITSYTSGVTYNVHTFTTPGTFTVTSSGTLGVVDYLVIGGGGGGAARAHR